MTFWLVSILREFGKRWGKHIKRSLQLIWLHITNFSAYMKLSIQTATAVNIEKYNKKYVLVTWFILKESGKK